MELMKDKKIYRSTNTENMQMVTAACFLFIKVYYR